MIDSGGAYLDNGLCAELSGEDCSLHAGQVALLGEVTRQVELVDRAALRRPQLLASRYCLVPEPRPAHVKPKTCIQDW